MDAIRVVVRGRVQGVGFRAFVCDLAESLGLEGEVWNRRDGSVELVAGGEPALLDDLVAKLRNGPGRVEETTVAPAVHHGLGPGFRVGYSR